MVKLPTWTSFQECKCCGLDAALYGVVDFSKNCRERKGYVLPLSGIPVYYYRCTVCGFIFTTDFDGLSEEQLKELVYNDLYSDVDPDWEKTRPQDIANLVMKLFSNCRDEISILDYGCGNGLVSKILLNNGFSEVHNYDPLVEKFATLPKGRFDVVLCFEVLEHLTDPVRACRDIADLRADKGIVLHSTLLQPQSIDEVKLDWWYAGPRNGHFSLFGADSLKILWGRFGLSVTSMNHDIHIAYKCIPDFAAHILKGPK